VEIRRQWLDVVITQSNSYIPGSANLLTGRPVYTVYVPVDSGKEWVMQYCIPAGSGDGRAAARNGNVLQLGSVSPLIAPYAFAIFRPAVRLKPGVRYAFLHGFINVAGRFADLKEVGDVNLDNGEAVVRAVKGWEFEPASKDGVPVGVEVLICIPRGSA
jgi:hypothetical protein